MVKKYIYTIILLFALIGLKPLTLSSGNFVQNRDTIAPQDSCLADFTHHQVPNQPLQIKFIDNSFGNISLWHWDFDDGTISSLQSPTHTFPYEGTYNVCLTITYFLSGCTDTYCEPLFVGDRMQFYAFFDYHKNHVTPLNYQFIDLSTGNIDTWQWDFGDGTGSYLSNPEHTYSEPGEYLVCLWVEDRQGIFFDIYCDNIYIETQPNCQALFEYTKDSLNPLTFQFENTSLGAYQFWLWKFGDGAQSTEVAPTHTYADKGIYLVCLEIYKSNGGYQCYDWYCTEVNAIGYSSPCNADFSYELQPPNPLSVQFFSQSQGEADFWFWDFGDGNTSYEQNPAHTYLEEGTFDTHLIIVNNSSGCYDSTYQNVEVFEAPDCEALFEFDYIQSDSMSVQFTDLSYGMISEWYWDFGDGNTSTLQNPVHTYLYEDSFTVCLTASSIWGPCQDTFCDTVLIDVSPVCAADFEFMQNPDNLFEFSFYDLSAGDIESWEWDFGDGTTSDEQNPVHTYTDEGEFVICLTIYDDWGPCEDTYCDTIFIEVPQLCNADFEFDQSEENPFEYIFTDLSTGIINTWEWDFGDGNSSSLQNPTHIYSDTGAYEVCLLVYNIDSLLFCNSTNCYDVVVSIPSPSCEAAFEAEVDQGVNKPNLYHFQDISLGGPDEWNWDFGDGNTSAQQNPDHQYTDGGVYEVTLTIIKQNPWGGDCEDSETIQLITPQYFDFGGMVFAGEFPINNPEHTGDTARVFLYRKINNDLIPVDTTFFTQYGYFYYLNMLSGNYLLKFNLTLNSNNAQSYFPTYFGDRLFWDEAQVLSIADSNNYAVHVHLHEMPEITFGGIGKIEGFVVLTASRFFGDGPQQDTEILLFDTNGDPYHYTYSNDNGNFIFEDLPLGTYTLIAESAGLLTESYTVTLTNSNPTISDVQLELFEIINTIGSNKINKATFKFFPNPVGETLSLLIDEATSKRYHLRIYDLLGQLMHSEEIILGQSSKLVNIPMGYLNPGVYLAEIISLPNQKHNTFKIIKK